MQSIIKAQNWWGFKIHIILHNIVRDKRFKQYIHVTFLCDF